MNTTNPILTARRHLGERLFALALRWSRSGTPEKKNARLEAVRAIKGLPKRHSSTVAAMRRAAEEVARVAACISRERRNRIDYAAIARGLRPSYYDPFYRRPLSKWGLVLSRRLRRRVGGEIRIGVEARLRRRTAEEIARYAGDLYRCGAAGGTSFVVDLTSCPGLVGYEVQVDRNFDTYKGKYKGSAASEDHHRVTVPRRWLRAVQRAGIAVVDDMLTLDAAPLVSPDPAIRLYGATWASQGRGYAVHTHRGVIAVHDDGIAYHGADADAALRGLARKRNAPTPAQRSLVAMERAARLHGDVVMTAKDAEAIGACSYGIAHWRERTGLTAETATVAQVVAGWQSYPAPEAVAAVRHAIRRSREG